MQLHRECHPLAPIWMLYMRRGVAPALCQGDVNAGQRRETVRPFLIKLSIKAFLQTYDSLPIHSTPHGNLSANTANQVQVIYEDDVCLAFRDISPTAPTHFLVIPKVKGCLSRLSKATEADKSTLGHLLFVAQQVANQGGMLQMAFT